MCMWWERALPPACCCEPQRAHATSCRETLRFKELPRTPRTTLDLGSLEGPGAVPRARAAVGPPQQTPWLLHEFVSAGSFHGHGWPSWPLNLMITPIYRRPHCRRILGLYNSSLPTDHAISFRVDGTPSLRVLQTTCKCLFFFFFPTSRYTKQARSPGAGLECPCVSLSAGISISPHRRT